MSNFGLCTNCILIRNTLAQVRGLVNVRLHFFFLLFRTSETKTIAISQAGRTWRELGKKNKTLASAGGKTRHAPLLSRPWTWTWTRTRTRTRTWTRTRTPLRLPDPPSLQLSQERLQRLRREPQQLQQVVLAVAHPEAEQHICHVVPAQQHPAQSHGAGPQQHQHPQRRRQHQVGQQEAAAHGGARGVAGGEGVAVDGEGGEHVHAVVDGPAPAHRGLDHAHQDQVQ